MDFNLDRQKIYNSAAGSLIFANGERLFNEGKVVTSALYHRGYDYIITGAVDDKSRQRTVHIVISEDLSIKSTNCSCNSIWRGSCEHCIAVMLRYTSPRHQKKQSSKKIDDAAHKNNDSFQAQKSLVEGIEALIIDKSRAIMRSSDRVNIMPTLSLERDDFFLTFTIGTDRMYTLKSIKEFLNNVENRSLVSYGKNLEFVHSMDAFSETAVYLINFMKKNYGVSRSSYYRGYYSSKTEAKALKLNNSSLEVFIKNYKGLLNLSLDYNLFENIKISLEKPDVGLTLSRSRDNKIVLKVSQLPICYVDLQGSFLVVFKDLINYAEMANLDALMKIVASARGLKDNEIEFSEKLESRLIGHIFPELVDMGLLSPDELAKIAPEEATKKYKVFLDYQDDFISARVFIGEQKDVHNVLFDEEQGEDYFDKAFICKLFRGLGFFSDKLAFFLSDENKIYDFIKNGIHELSKFSEIFLSQEFKKISPPIEEKTKEVDIKVSGNILEINFPHDAYSLKELMDVLGKYKEAKKYVRLKSGRFIDIDNEYYRETLSLLDSLRISSKNIDGNKIKLKKYDAFFVDDLLNENDFFKAEKEDGFKKLVEDVKNYKSLDFKLPKSLDGVLRDYQVKGFKWLKTLSYYSLGGILADEMGLGKTVQAIALIQSEKNNGVKKKSLVVCPTSLIYNWQKEIDRFGDNLTSEVLTGLAEKRKKLISDSEADIMITTYDTLKRDIDEYKDKQFNILIADEAQNIKNPTTQNAKALKSLKSEKCYALTGTPIENSLTELWSIFDFILPGYLGSLTSFNKKYARDIVKNDDKEKRELLRRKIRPFIIKRTKKEVLTELPEKIETVSYTDMTDEQRKVYAAYMLTVKSELSELKTEKGGYSRNHIKILSMITRLRQICCDPRMFLENYEGGSGKLAACMELIESSLAEGHRLLLFSQFTSMLKLIQNELNGADYFYLDGSTSSRDRMDMTERFNAGENNIFLISLKAGGTGLNLTGADVVIHFDPWWNPSIMAQATDRAHRIGQQNVVSVINLVAKDTIEEKIIELQMKKKELIDSVLDEGSTFINNLSDDELEYLLGRD